MIAKNTTSCQWPKPLSTIKSWAGNHALLYLQQISSESCPLGCSDTPFPTWLDEGTYNAKWAYYGRPKSHGLRLRSGRWTPASRNAAAARRRNGLPTEPFIRVRAGLAGGRSMRLRYIQ